MYVAARDADVIRKIDTVTLDIVATYDVGGPLGDGLAMIGTRLFYGAGDRQFMTIGMYDIATGENNRSYIGGVYEPLLRTSPALPGRLVVATTHTSPSTLYLYDVTGDSGVRLRQSSPHGAIGGNLKEVEISADGTRIWTAAGAPYVISEVRTSDLTLSGGSFETGAYPTATASAIIGGTELVAAGTAYNRTAFVFNAASRELLTNTPIPGETADRGLQFSRDGSKLYAAVEAGASADLVTIDRATSRVATAPMFGRTLSDLYFDMGELAVDPGTGRVFVTAHDAISVYNPDGTYGRTLSQRGPRSMAFSATRPTSTAARCSARWSCSATSSRSGGCSSRSSWPGGWPRSARSLQRPCCSAACQPLGAWVRRSASASRRCTGCVRSPQPILPDVRFSPMAAGRCCASASSCRQR